MADGELRTINPDDNLFVWGTIKAEGFADGEAIIVEEDAPLYTDEAGVDNEITRIKNKDRRARITVRLQPGSPTNALFSAMRELDKAGKGVFPVTVKDAGSIYFGAKCWLEKNPKRTTARTIQPKEWVFRVAKLDPFDGFLPLT